MRLIDADELLNDCELDDVAERNFLEYIVNKQLTVDAVEVVRCKDCKYRGELVCPMFSEEYTLYDDDGYSEIDIIEIDNTEDDAFCSVGMRRDGD